MKAALSLVVVFVPVIAMAEPNPLKPGLWEMTVQMEMPGMPQGMPPQVFKHCLTEKDVVPHKARPGEDCKMTSYKLKGTSITWSMRCTHKDGGEADIEGNGTYTNDSFQGTVQSKMKGGKGDGMAMTMKMNSKRLGPCDKKF